MTQALHGVSRPETVHKHLKEHLDALRKGLETINESNIEFMKAGVEQGCPGFFYGIAGRGSYWSQFSEVELEECTLKYDKYALESVDAAIKMLHICNTLDENPENDGVLMTDGWFKKYPVNILNWWDHHFTPALEAKEVYKDKFCIAACLDHKFTLIKSPADIDKEVIEVIESVGEGGGFILAGGCTVNIAAPIWAYDTVGKTVEKYGVYKR